MMRRSKSGHLILAGSLGQPKTAKTLRSGKTKASVSRGPYVKTKEPFGVFFIIEAQDMGEAVEIASKHPGTHVGEHLGGGIEVRPIEMFDDASGR